MRYTQRALLLGGLLAAGTSDARAQDPSGPPHASIYYAAPGLYATTYGSPSFKVPRTYSSFSSPYGVGYGYGYRPTTFLPGPFGVGLWRPGSGLGYGPGSSIYSTFAVPPAGYPVAIPAHAPIGAYAPGFGPSPFGP
jgi:hypothetical protein